MLSLRQSGALFLYLCDLPALHVGESHTGDWQAPCCGRQKGWLCAAEERKRVHPINFDAWPCVSTVDSPKQRVPLTTAPRSAARSADESIGLRVRAKRHYAWQAASESSPPPNDLPAAPTPLVPCACERRCQVRSPR